MSRSPEDGFGWLVVAAIAAIMLIGIIGIGALVYGIQDRRAKSQCGAEGGRVEYYGPHEDWRCSRSPTPAGAERAGT